jgi:hypothetical protein
MFDVTETLPCIAILLVSSCLLQAQDFVAPNQIKGTSDSEIWAGGVPAQHDGSTTFNLDFLMAGARFGRVLTAAHGRNWMRGTLQWDFDVIPLFVVTNLQSAYGAEIDPIVGRWNFQHHGRNAPYFEMAGGIAFTNTKIPPGDTSKINVVPSFGFGWQFFCHTQRSLDVSLHAWHLSNAWTAPRNPSANGLLFAVGYHWFGPHRSNASNHHESEPDAASR